MEEAAREWLDTWYSSSFTMEREFGADLCGGVHGYAIGPTNIADPEYPNQVVRLGCVSGQATGNVHTHHACMSGLPYDFSPGDFSLWDAEPTGFEAYLGAPDLKVRRYKPDTGRVAELLAGQIRFIYQGEQIANPCALR
jgi:hypothetical protein